VTGHVFPALKKIPDHRGLYLLRREVEDVEIRAVTSRFGAVPIGASLHSL
jgi:hypothetical protein